MNQETPLDYGIKAFEDPTKLFRNEAMGEDESNLPIIFNDFEGYLKGYLRIFIKKH